MRLGEFAQRLDDFFDVERFAEPDGWDFAISAGEKASLLCRGSDVFQRTFNGLMLGADRFDSPLDRVHLLVFPEASLVESVLAAEHGRCGGSVIVTHHPVDMETGGRGFLAIPEAQLDALTEAGIGVYVLHAPLDCHPGISTSRALAEGLGLAITDCYAPYVGGLCGVIGEQAPEPFGAFAERVRRLCDLPFFLPEQVRFAGRDVSRVAIVAGGGDEISYLEAAERLGADSYLAGHWWTPHPGEWCDQNRSALRQAIAGCRMNLLSASHDGSELVVFRDQLSPLFESWGLGVQLHRQANHWR
jgi:putative NIF3 family GTP cyclohydrolase 1 type 2